MLTLAVLVTSYFLLLVSAGGLYYPVLIGVNIALGLASLIEIIRGLRAKRKINIAIVCISVSLFLCIFAFLIPKNVTPDFLHSNEKNFLYSSAESILNEIYKSASVKKPDSTEFYNTLNLHGTWRVLLIFLMFFNAVYLTATLSRAHKMLLSDFLFAGAFIIALAGMVGHWYNNPEGKIWWLIDIGAKKNTACFVNPNHYGAFLCLFLPLCIIRALNNYNKKDKLFFSLWVAGYIFLCLGIIASLSKGAFLIAVAISLLTIIFKWQKSNHFNVLATFFTFGIIVLFTYIMPSELESEMRSEFNESGRLFIYSKVPQFMKEHPYGVGPGAYRFTSNIYLSANTNTELVAHHSESTLFTLLQELGTVNFLLIISLALCTLLYALKCHNEKLLSNRMSSWGLLALIAASAHGLYDYPYGVPVYAFFIAMMIGMIVAKGQTFDMGVDQGYLKALSFLTILLPALTLIYSISSIKNLDSFKNDFSSSIKDKNLDELTATLYKQPSSWFNWYTLGYKLWKTEGPENRLLAEKAVKHAAILFPSNAKVWNSLSVMREKNKNYSTAKEAYKRSFLLLDKTKRKEALKDAKYFFSPEELEELIHQSLNTEEISKDFYRKL